MLLLVEVGRELSSIVLLAGLALLADRAWSRRFAYFAIAFGVFDIFFYVWLKIFINWPESFLTWDLLFLIPIPWIGPVISPILVSLVLISGALVVLYLEQNFEQAFHLNQWEWFGELFAGLIILSSYFWNVNRLETEEHLLDYPYCLLFSGLLLGVIIFSVHIQKQYFSRTEK